MWGWIQRLAQITFKRLKHSSRHSSLTLYQVPTETTESQRHSPEIVLYSEHSDIWASTRKNIIVVWLFARCLGIFKLWTKRVHSSRLPASYLLCKHELWFGLWFSPSKRIMRFIVGKECYADYSGWCLFFFNASLKWRQQSDPLRPSVINNLFN